MILLTQESKIDKQRLDVLLDKYGHTEYNFNEHLILDDIDKLKEWESQAVTAIRLENLKKIRKYLDTMAKRASKGPFSVDWILSGNRIISVPVEIRRAKMYNIQATDYIDINNESIISLDYSEILNIIAYEIAYTDFDVSIDDIEEVLKDVGIITIYPRKILSKLIDEKTYEKSLVMRIGDTPYLAPNKKTIYSYFGDELTNDGKYFRVINESCSTAISIIVENILNKINRMGYNIKIYGVFEDSVYFMLPDGRSKEIEKELSEPVIVRAFGRKFEVTPKVQVY